jgi:hypothetical protein
MEIRSKIVIKFVKSSAHRLKVLQVTSPLFQLRVQFYHKSCNQSHFPIAPKPLPRQRTLEISEFFHFPPHLTRQLFI